MATIPDYVADFTKTYAHIDGANDIAFTDISNAIAVFMAHEWRSDTAPFDAVLHGDLELEDQARAGLKLFYGEAGCSTCHSGALLTDHKFHAMGAPQIGPGKAATFEDHHRDEGRFRVTGDPKDLYAFRTPSLRNVALTGPYGHAGAHKDLSIFLKDHANPKSALLSFDRAQVVLPKFDSDDFTILDDAEQTSEIAQAVTTPPVTLSSRDITALMAFLETLTDPISISGRLGVPDKVPSGLSVPSSN